MKKSSFLTIKWSVNQNIVKAEKKLDRRKGDLQGYKTTENTKKITAMIKTNNNTKAAKRSKTIRRKSKC